MEDILKQVFHGSYSAIQILSMVTGTETPEQYRRGEISMQLKSQVSEEQFKLVLQLIDSMDQSQTENMERAFEMGVQFGAQFVIAACLKNNAGQETEVME